MPNAYPARLNSLEKKLYQLIISRLDGDRIHSRLYQDEIFELVDKGIGGFIIFGGKRDEAGGFIDKIQSASEIPLFIASDIEQGVGQQIKETTLFPSQMAVAAAIDRTGPEDVALLKNVIKAIADEAVDIGINMPLIPVLDVNKDPENPIICTRAFSDNPGDVSWFGSEYIRVLEGAGLISCAKHFPGHGDTSIDSHLLLPVITKSHRDLMETDISPFIEAIKAGVSSIMVGHLSIPAFDSMPASLSKKIITLLLREELGFEGLVLTDALLMNALEGIKDIPIKCIDAGADILLHPVDADLTVKDLTSAIESNELDEGRIDVSVDRILKIKAKFKETKRSVIVHPHPNPPPSRGREYRNITDKYPPSPGGRGLGGGGAPLQMSGVDYQRHAALSTRLTGMSVTIVKNTPGLLPISDATGVRVIFAGDSRFHETSPLRDHFDKVSAIAAYQDRRGFPSSPGKDLLKISEKISDEANMSPRLIKEHGSQKLTPLCPPLVRGELKGGVFSDDIAIFAIFSDVAAWKGSSGIDDEERHRIMQLIKEVRGSIVVSFGSPYILRHFKEADILIAAYNTAEQAQLSVIKCLKGETEFRGHLPVDLKN